MSEWRLVGEQTTETRPQGFPPAFDPVVATLNILTLERGSLTLVITTNMNTGAIAQSLVVEKTLFQHTLPEDVLDE